MTLAVLFIAASHGVPILFVAARTHSRIATFVTALACAAVGLFSGNPANILANLLAVGVGDWIAVMLLKAHARSKNVQSTTQTAQHIAEKSSSNGGGFAALSVVAGVAFLYFVVWNLTRMTVPGKVDKVRSVQASSLGNGGGEHSLIAASLSDGVGSMRTGLQRCSSSGKLL